MRVSDAIMAEPWAITQEGLHTIVAVAERSGEDPKAVEARLGRPLDNTERAMVRDGVAIIPVRGPIFRYANLFTMISGATSISVLAKDFSEAMDNPDVRAVLFNVDSPGGMVNGTGEFSDMVFKARGKKPIVSYVSHLGASGGYWIASAADRIVVAPTSELGSIGVLTEVVRDDEGKSTVRFVSKQSPMKRADPTTEKGRASYQALTDDLAQIFVDTVARNRGVSSEDVLEKFGRGGLMLGAAAVEAGLADSLGSFEETLASLSGAGGERNTRMEVSMSKESQAQGPEQVTITAEYLKVNHPDIVASIQKEATDKVAATAKAEGLTQGAQQERERIQGVMAAGMPGHEKLVQELAFDGKTSPGDAALKVLAAERKAREQGLTDRKEDAADAGKVPSQAPPGEEEDEDQAVAEVASYAPKRPKLPEIQ